MNTSHDTTTLDTFLSSCSNPDGLDNFLDGIPKAKAKPKEREPAKFIFQYDENGCIKLSPQRKAELLAQQAAYRNLTEDTCMSFDEWKDMGYWVKRGAKSMFKDALGTPQFTIEQVTPPKRY
jgi:hypothetical protein